MRTRRIFAAATVVCGFAAAVAVQAADKHPEGAIAARLLDIKWKEGPLPGSKTALLAGDPKTGMHHSYLKLADDAYIPPHWHTADEYVTVVQGTVLFGTGDNADRNKTRLYAPGAFIYMPAGVRHFAWAKGEVILSQTRGGPLDFHWVHPEDAPKTAPASTTPQDR